MADFIILSIVILIIALISNSDKRLSKIGFWTCFVIFMLMSAFRGPTVGNDTTEYLRIFNEANAIDFDASNSRYEIGYILLNQLLGKFTVEGQIVFAVAGAFIFFSFGRFILKYSKSPWLSLILFFFYGFFVFSMSAIRQSIAIGILLFAYDYILQKKFVKFLMLLLLATAFHMTAIFFIFAYLVSYLKPTLKTYLIILSVTAALFICFNLLLSNLFLLFETYEGYENEYGGGARIAIIIYISIVSLVLLFSYFTRKRIPAAVMPVYNKEFLMVFVALCTYILALNINILDRIANYYNVFSLILLPTAIHYQRYYTRLSMTISVVIAFFAYAAVLLWLRPNWNSVFPYYIY